MPTSQATADDTLAVITSDRVAASCDAAPEGEAAWYPPIMIGAGQVGAAASSAAAIRRAYAALEAIEADPYALFLKRYYLDGLRRFGDGWGYADIVTSLVALTETLRPRNYLEIGVRTGRSAAVVGMLSPETRMYLFDMWMPDYAGMPNPGPDYVRSQLARAGHSGSADFIDGNSHETLPRFFAANPTLSFDIVTVDGDHSDEGAAQDIRDVLPRIAIGGAIVFDDIAHPQHPGLWHVWRAEIVDNPRFSAWSYRDLGYGVGFALRRW